MIEILLVIITTLLAVICILTFGILLKVSHAKTGISSLIQTTAAFHDINADQCRERFELTTAHLEQLVEATVSAERSISEIKEVTDVIYQYKLPNAAERKILDQIEIDNEVSSGILNADRRHV
ncbi:hypothetical protein [Pseudomonas marginalis]|uniref:hypothetical protein n=1 Tax=Pseudomonas marginalis TaxID=298 RepID=UPI00127F187D|nr:hypothetical protein [Pseudomonas marginalis]KAA8552320.1 hypothetical protein FX984_04831 [Pseudomonas marginalis]